MGSDAYVSCSVKEGFGAASDVYVQDDVLGPQLATLPHVPSAPVFNPRPSRRIILVPRRWVLQRGLARVPLAEGK